jgi:signal transduction histidine kinase
MQSRAKTVWTRLTLPAASIENENERHQASVLMSMLLIVLMFGIIIIPIWLLVSPDFTIVPLISAAIVSTLVVAYFVSRRGNFQVGSYILIGLVLAVVVVTVLTAPGLVIQRMIALNFLIPAILLASLFTGTAFTLAIAVIGFIATFTFYFVPDVPGSVVYAYLVFITVMSALIVVASSMRSRYLKRLSASEQRLDAFFAQSLDGFFFMAMDQPIVWNDSVDKEKVLDYIFAHERITRVNDATLAQYQATQAQFLGRTPNDVYAHDLAQGRAAWRRMLDEGHLHHESEERLMNGEPIWIDGEYVCFYDSAGRVTGHFGVQRNVSETRRSAALNQAFLNDMKALQELHLELSQIEDLDRLYYRMVELTQTRFEIDRLALFLIDSEADELVGTYGVDTNGMIRDERYFHDHMTDAHWTREIVNSPKHTQYWENVPLYDNSQEVGTGWMVATALWDGHEAIGYLVTDNFISHRAPRSYQTELISLLGSTFGHLIRLKQTTAHLRASEMRQRAVLTAIPDLIFRNDRQGTFLGYHAPNTAKLAAKPEEFLGRKITDVFSPETAALHMEHLNHVFETGNETIYEYSLSIGGQMMDFEARMVMSADNEVIDIVRDVSERKQAQEQAFALAVERERVQVLSRFVQNASHELRTPLAVINTNLYLMGKASDDEQRRRYIERVEQHVQRLTRLLNMMMSMTKLDSEVPFVYHEVDVNHLIYQVVAGIQPALSEKKLPVQLKLDRSLAHVEVDSDWLEQALEQLLGNAIRFTTDEPSAEQAIMLSTLRRGEAMVIEIRDAGVGISPEALPHIFERFWREDEMHRTPGFGLGLALAQNVVERHGGMIEVESEVGSGSTFRIVLPFKRSGET